MSSSSSEETVTSSNESSVSIDQEDQLENVSLQENPLAFTNEQNGGLTALKDLQRIYNQLESRYLKSVNELEYQFQQQSSALFERRSLIINGLYEPTDDECRLRTDFIETNERIVSTDENGEKGIPSFWLRTLKQVPIIAETIEDWDEPILKCLKDIKLQLHIEPIIGFTLEFHFDSKAKEYFHNEILTKFYEMQIDVDDESLFYEGTAIVRSVGCQINWLDTSKNVTRHEITGEERRSFFHFFTSPSTNSTDQIDDLKLATDFQIGHYIRENLIPKAVLFYTGEIFDDEDGEYEFSDDDQSDEHSYSMTEETGDGEHL